MAYPGENLNDKYNRYVIRWATGEEGSGPKMSKKDWVKTQVKKKMKDTTDGDNDSEEAPDIELNAAKKARGF